MGTDVVVLTLAFFSNLCTDEFLVEFGTEKIKKSISKSMKLPSVKKKRDAKHCHFSLIGNKYFSFFSARNPRHGTRGCCYLI